MSENWRTFGDTSRDAFRQALAGSPLAKETDAIYDAGRPFTRMLYAQARIESDLGRSELSRTRRNFLGQRPRGGDGFKTFTTFAECAAYYHDKLADPTYAYANTVTVEEFVHTYAPAWDDNDEADYRRRLVDYAELLPQIKGEDQPVPALATIDYSSLSFPVHVSLIPESQPNQNPGLPLDPTFVTLHETGSPDPAHDTAAGEANWVRGGADGQQLSVHFFVDAHEAWQIMPLSRVAWHAGDGANGPGNRTSIAIETCIEPTTLHQTRANVRALAALLIKTLGIEGIAYVVPHQHWSGKTCPRICLTTPGCWETQIAGIAALLAESPAHAEPQPPLLPPKAHRDANNRVWLPLKQARWKALQTTPRRQWADEASPEVGSPVRSGETITAVYSVANEFGEVWFVSRNGARMKANAFIPKD